MSEGKFSKPWQVTDKIIEWFILQFISYILWMTQTQEKITCRVLKILKWYEGMCMSWAKIPKPWQVTCKMIEWLFFTIHILHFTNDSNSRNNNSYGFKNSQMDTWGCVY